VTGASPAGTPSRALATRAGVISGIAAPLIAWGLSAVVIAGWPGYDPVSESISLLATAPLGWLQTVAFVMSGVLGAAWAFALPRLLGTTTGQRRLVLGLLLVQAAIAIGFALLPTDPSGAPVTTIGRLHLANFYLYAITMPLTLLALGLVMRGDPAWRRAAGPTLVIAGLVVAAAVVVPATVDGPLTPWLGLLERVYVALPSAWQVGAGIVAWRLLDNPVPPRS
jgi:hypothetical protein